MNATTKQIEFATRLVKEIFPMRGTDAERIAFCESMRDKWPEATEDVSKMSDYIDLLMETHSQWTHVPGEGVYVVDGEFYKVQESQETGRFYAKHFDANAASWEYVGRRPFGILTERTRATTEQAARFGALTGTCVFCSRKLTDERSIEAGYGAICADNHGLAWG